MQLVEENHGAPSRREPWQRQLIVGPGKDAVAIRITQRAGAEIFSDCDDVAAGAAGVGKQRYGFCAHDASSFSNAPASKNSVSRRVAQSLKSACPEFLNTIVRTRGASRASASAHHFGVMASRSPTMTRIGTFALDTRTRGASPGVHCSHAAICRRTRQSPRNVPAVWRAISREEM